MLIVKGHLGGFSAPRFPALKPKTGRNFLRTKPLPKPPPLPAPSLPRTKIICDISIRVPPSSFRHPFLTSEGAFLTAVPLWFGLCLSYLFPSFVPSPDLDRVNHSFVLELSQAFFEYPAHANGRSKIRTKNV